METKPLEVSDIGFLLERIGSDCDRMQFVRELTQNSLEAVAGINGKGQILWTYDQGVFEREGIKKLCIIDNGSGMTGPEMVEYINNLASSSKAKGIDQNFGVGAKISAGINNPLGMVFRSWKNGKGAMIHFWRDPVTGVYGLKPLVDKTGKNVFWLPLDDSEKPDLIEKHGTKVTLLGRSRGENTIEAPEDAKNKSRWIRYYLNSRYARIPEDVSIIVNEGWTERAYGFPVVGQSSFLSIHAESKGILPLKNARAFWWIMPEEVKGRSEIETLGHVAAVHKDEIYEMKAGHAARPTLQQFGIVIGTQRVIIYVEPDTTNAECITDTARSRLRLNGKDLPWLDWAAEFESNMPPELRTYIDKLMSKDADDQDYKENIRKRLQEVSDLYDFSSYMPFEQGERVSPSDVGVRRREGTRGRRRSSGGGAERPVMQPDDDSAKASFKDAAGSGTGKLQKQIVIPNVVWVSCAAGNRSVGDHLEESCGSAAAKHAFD